ncbi:DUF3080 domain-containing protein [Salinispirillum sp. LH 10-3-1]|uniref:DUF3080 domain-containing protein n=1 Tax=Salinispirillum sp. LH 10-3-1 TaxID=2952525 RepID=A0AB38YJ63_9GAMM
MCKAPFDLADYELFTRMVHRVRFLFFAVAVLLLSGCAKTGQDLFDDYLNRLSNVMDAPKPEWAVPSVVTAPPARAVQWDVPEVRINLLSFWDTRHCELFTLIGERNSILGRVMAPTQRWRFESRLLGAIEACMNDPRTDDDLRAVLAEWQAEKQTYWPLVTWNGTLGAPEVRHLLQTESAAWPADAIPGIHGTLDDLRIMTGWVENWPSLALPDNREFEALYQRMGQHNVLGQWHRSVQLSIAGLEEGNSRLQHGVAAGRLCPAQRATQRSTAANNVLVMFFIGEVQPYIARLNGYGEELLGAVRRLATMTDAVPEVWDTHMQMLEADAELLRTVTREHVRLWQEVLAPCGGVSTS